MRTVQKLYRYPVKGLTPEQLGRVDLVAGQGFPFDRTFAITNGAWVFDPATYTPRPKTDFLMLMQHERLAMLRAALDETAGTLTIVAPDGARVEAALDDPEALDRVAAFVGEAAGAPLAGRPRWVRMDGMRFTDVSVVSPAMMHAISVVNLASVRELERAIGQPVDPLRFRANVYYDGGEPWEELGWVDRELTVGPVRLRGVLRTRRCAATNVNPSTGARDLGIPQALIRTVRHGDMGVYLEVVEGGRLATGVPLLPPGDTLRG